MQNRTALEASQHSQESTNNCSKSPETIMSKSKDETNLFDRFNGLYRDYQGPFKTMPDLGETSVDNHGNVVLKLSQVGASFLNTLRTENETTLESNKEKNEKNSVLFKLSNG